VDDVLLDFEVFEERALKALKTDNLTGYHHVRPVKNSRLNPFQAMAYVGPKDQRGLGSFPTAREAACVVLHFMLGRTPSPPTPGKKDRNKRGTGARKRDRCNHCQGLCTCHTSRHFPLLSHVSRHFLPGSQVARIYAPALTGQRNGKLCHWSAIQMRIPGSSQQQQEQQQEQRTRRWTAARRSIQPRCGWTATA
jgi:hypothetical protein